MNSSDDGVLSFHLDFDMRAPGFGTSPVVLYRAALEMSRWADARGFATVELREHHASEDGYLPSPVVMGAAVAAVTQRLLLHLNLVVLPLYDPVKLAEDLAVLDLISEGRLRLVLGAGYRDEEYQQFGKDIKKRPSAMVEGIEFLKKAWTGEPFDHHGATIKILPRPAQDPRPALVMGGASPASARRAAEIADGYNPVVPALLRPYEERLAELGKPVPVSDIPKIRNGTVTFTHIADDPDAAWQKIAPHAMWETNEYARWAGGRRGTPYRPAASAEELRAQGNYRILTPEQAVEVARAEGGLRFMPLMGGLDPEVSWQSLRLLETKVMPRL